MKRKRLEKRKESDLCCICGKVTYFYDGDLPVCNEVCRRELHPEEEENEKQGEKDFLDYVREAESLDEVKQLFAELKIRKREINWVDGDTVAIAVDKFGPQHTYGQLAEIGLGTVKHLQQMERISRAYGPSERDMAYPWSLYRAAYNAAVRTGEEPIDVFVYGVEQGWHSKDFSQYGKARRDVYVLRCDCPICASRFVIECDDPVSAALECPVCRQQGEHTLLPGEFSLKMK